MAKRSKKTDYDPKNDPWANGKEPRLQRGTIEIKKKSSSDLQELRKEIDNVNYQLQNLEIGLVFISFVLCLFATFFLSKYFRKSNRLLQIILISLLTCSLLTFFYMLFNLLR